MTPENENIINQWIEKENRKTDFVFAYLNLLREEIKAVNDKLDKFISTIPAFK